MPLVTYLEITPRFAINRTTNREDLWSIGKSRDNAWAGPAVKKYPTGTIGKFIDATRKKIIFFSILFDKILQTAQE